MPDFEQAIQNAATKVFAKRGLTSAQAKAELDRLRQIPIAFSPPTDQELDAMAAESPQS
jgi:hypothetical protein